MVRPDRAPDAGDVHGQVTSRNTWVLQTTRGSYRPHVGRCREATSDPDRAFVLARRLRQCSGGTVVVAKRRRPCLGTSHHGRVRCANSTVPPEIVWSYESEWFARIARPTPETFTVKRRQGTRGSCRPHVGLTGHTWVKEQPFRGGVLLVLVVLWWWCHASHAEGGRGMCCDVQGACFSRPGTAGRSMALDSKTGRASGCRPST